MSEPFSGRSVQREVLADALQRSTTLYPFALGCLSGIYAFFFSPFFGGTVPTLGVALGAVALSAGSFTWHYLVRGEQYARDKARQKIAEEEARRTEAGEAELEQRQAELNAGFVSLHLDAGLRALEQLVDEWGHVQRALRRAETDGVLAAAPIARSARETYRQGLGVLALAMELQQAIAETDRPSLEEEVGELQAEIATLSRDGRHADRVRVKQATLASHQARLELLAEQELQVERLLHQADLAEAALERARMALPTLSASISEQNGAEVTEMLERTVDQARRIQQHLRGEVTPDEETRPLQEKSKREERERVR